VLERVERAAAGDMAAMAELEALDGLLDGAETRKRGTA
jgi:hypothetical protein